jgi:adenine-specific DNA glycosylase
VSTAAIASFSYNEVVPVDGMCFVLSRYFDVETDIALVPKEFAALLSN